MRFAAKPCVTGKQAQQWFLDTGATPADGTLTAVRSAVALNATAHSCWRAQFAFVKQKNSCALHTTAAECTAGCEPVSSNATCGKAGAWAFHARGWAPASSTGGRGRGVGSTHKHELFSRFLFYPCPQKCSSFFLFLEHTTRIAYQNTLKTPGRVF